ncbi:hypothetical protein [Vibrio agarivorans]|uniref:Uncharacterized protein n=1 Tax=Vibrio agarivorans TaxID=153622 RepID=A0ABT7Y722_9VIBR|nr:hypothetical protein [Vibrio agarivorans]MDN2483852.1 hypothetical protein [Vibrio agarivorans]
MNLLRKILAWFDSKHLRTYVVWNPEKIYCYTDEPYSYEGLLEVELKTKSSFSSIIRTHDINQFIEATLNEFDVDVYHQQI